MSARSKQYSAPLFSRAGAFGMAAALVLALGTSFAFAKDDGPGKHAERMIKKMEKELDLSADQVTRLRAILTPEPGEGSGPHAGKEDKDCKGCPKCAFGGHDGRGGHGMGLMAADGEFAKQMRAATVDTAALNEGFEERVAHLRARHARHVARFAAIHDLLTPDQRAKAAARMEKMQAKLEKRCERKCGKSCAK